MKTLFTLFALMAAAVAANSQTTPAGDTMQTQIVRQLKQRPADQQLVVVQQKPNEIKLNGVSYSGIAVQMAKTGNPLQLINPTAPPEYGSSEDNVARDPITGRISGLKIFSISF